MATVRCPQCGSNNQDVTEKDMCWKCGTSLGPGAKAAEPLTAANAAQPPGPPSPVSRPPAAPQAAGPDPTAPAAAPHRPEETPAPAQLERPATGTSNQTLEDNLARSLKELETSTANLNAANAALKIAGVRLLRAVLILALVILLIWLLLWAIFPRK